MKTILGLIVLSGPLFPLLVYLIVAIIVIIIASRLGTKRGKKHWGRNTALIILLLMFWDLPIVLGTHSYQCANNAGFTVYKTLEQWKSEHPGVAETLDPQKLPPEQYYTDSEQQYPDQQYGYTFKYYRYPSGYTVRIEYNKKGERQKETTTGLINPDTKQHIGYYLNPRFGWISKSAGWRLAGVGKEIEEIIDLETGEVLARYTDFRSGPVYGIVGGKNWQPWNPQHLKFWLGRESCERAGHNLPKRRFNEFSHLIKYQEEIKL